MNSSAKNIKANGIIHIIHGAIIAIITLIYMIAFSYISLSGTFFTMLILGGIAFLYIFIGYILYSLQKPNKVKGFIITSLVLASIEVIYSLFSGQIAGILFIVEFIMDIICLSNLDAYRKYKKSLERKPRKKTRR